MSKGLRQKEKSRLGEVPRWASVGPGAVMGALALGERRDLLLTWRVEAPVPAGEVGLERGGTPRRGQALGQPVCKLGPGRAGGPIALLHDRNEG